MEYEKVSFIRNVGTSVKNGKVWLFFEPPVLEAGGFKPGDRIEMKIVAEKRALVFRKSPGGDHVVSRRKRNGRERPLMDRCNEEITGIIRLRKRIDVLVSDGILVVREEQSFEFCLVEKPMLQGSELKRLRLASFPSGAGIASKALCSTGLFEEIFGGDIMPEAVETHRLNFADGTTYFGDLRRLHPGYLDPVDAVWLSPSCVEFSLLKGYGSAGGDQEGMGPIYANLVLASGAQLIMIEEVVQYFRSRSFAHLKGLLQHVFPYWKGPTVLDAYDFGSPAGRTRGYVVAARFPLDDFQWPQPRIPEHRRPTIEQVIGKDWESRAEWRPIEGTVMEGLLRKSSDKNNFRADSNRTLVKPSDTRMAALVASYSRIQVTSSYLWHPDHPELWRPFLSAEAARILDVPADFEFPEHIPETKRMVMLGNSVDCRKVRAIGIEAAYALMRNRLTASAGDSVAVKGKSPAPEREIKREWLTEDASGQISLSFESLSA